MRALCPCLTLEYEHMTTSWQPYVPPNTKGTYKRFSRKEFRSSETVYAVIWHIDDGLMIKLHLVDILITYYILIYLIKWCGTPNRRALLLKTLNCSRGSLAGDISSLAPVKVHSSFCSDTCKMSLKWLVVMELRQRTVIIPLGLKLS